MPQLVHKLTDLARACPALPYEGPPRVAGQDLPKPRGRPIAVTACCLERRPPLGGSLPAFAGVVWDAAEGRPATRSPSASRSSSSLVPRPVRCGTAKQIVPPVVPPRVVLVAGTLGGVVVVVVVVVGGGLVGVAPWRV